METLINVKDDANKKRVFIIASRNMKEQTTDNTGTVTTTNVENGVYRNLYKKTDSPYLQDNIRNRTHNFIQNNTFTFGRK